MKSVIGKIIGTLILVFFLNNEAICHSGRTDKDGCHRDSRTGERHCHKPKISTPPSPEAQLVAPSETGFFMVERVIDGDTIVLSNGEKVRFIGIDTPELSQSSKLNEDARRSGQDIRTIQKMGQEAYEFVRNLLEGKRVRLEFDVDQRDRYGRLLAYVFLEDGTFVNTKILEEGYGSIMTIPPNVKYRDQLLTLQGEARGKKKGLWRAEKNASERIIHKLEKIISKLERVILLLEQQRTGTLPSPELPVEEHQLTPQPEPIVEPTPLPEQPPSSEAQPLEESVSPPSSAVLCHQNISFDDTENTLGQQITTKYEKQGVVFSSPRGTPLLINEQWPGQSGDAKPVSQPFALGANNQGINQADPLIINFLADASNVSFSLIDVESNAIVRLYDKNNSLLEKINIAPQGGSGQNTNIQNILNSIRKIEITNSSSGDGMAFDNLLYDINCP